jgi:hypothetical protein
MPTLNFPRMLLVRQALPDLRISDVRGEVTRQLVASPLASRLKSGSRVAIGVGSRGINNMAAVARATVDYWKVQGMQPFVFPAMGSHGAATAEGQAEVLAGYGITEQTMGCPVLSQLEVVPLGKTEDGIETFMDRLAFESEGVMLINRVKWHTDFVGKIESGLFKMMAIGLGKLAGAQRYHTHAYKIGLERVIRSVGRQVLKSGKVLGGLALLEDAHHNTAKLDAVPAEEMEQREEANLALVKSWMARMPTDLDILIVDEIGKDISGAGMDTKVINRSVLGPYNPFPDLPKVERIFARDLTAASNGNGVGIGLADVVSDRLVNKVDWLPTRINSLSSSSTFCLRTPIHFSSDRESLACLLPTVGKLELGAVTIGWIRNTLELSVLALSENLQQQIKRKSTLEILSPPFPLEFDASGNLIDFRTTANAAVSTAP